MDEKLVAQQHNKKPNFGYLAACVLEIGFSGSCLPVRNTVRLDTIIDTHAHMTAKNPTLQRGSDVKQSRAATYSGR